MCGLTREPNRDIKGIYTMKQQQLFQMHLASRPGDVVITASGTTVIVLSGIVWTDQVVIQERTDKSLAS